MTHSSTSSPPCDYFQEVIEEMSDRLDKLERGLDALFPEPESVEYWERFWRDLLARYEDAFARLRSREDGAR